MARDKTTFELLLLSKDKSPRGILSMGYKALIGARSKLPTTYQKLWAQDGVTLTEENWDLLWSSFPLKASVTAIQWQPVKIMTR